MNRWRYLSRSALAALMIGMSGTVASAWIACILGRNAHTRICRTVERGGITWAYRVSRTVGFERIMLLSHATCSGSDEPEDVASYVEFPLITDSHRYDLAYVGAGWPFIAFRADSITSPPSVASRSNLTAVGYPAVVWKGGISIGDQPKVGLLALGAIVLPYRPVVVGLVGDVLFFGVSAVGVWTGARRFRRWRANRHRACASCGYPVMGRICPECGRSTGSRETP